MTTNVFYNVHEAAEILQMHAESVRRLSRTGKIHFGRVGKKYMYTLDQLKAYVSLNGSAATQAKINTLLETH